MSKSMELIEQIMAGDIDFDVMAATLDAAIDERIEAVGLAIITEAFEH